MEYAQSKIYFIPGELVIIKHELDNRPVMLVVEVVTSKICNFGVAVKQDPKNHFKGIRCGWFDHNQVWQEQIFSTKDLIKVEGE